MTGCAGFLSIAFLTTLFLVSFRASPIETLLWVGGIWLLMRWYDRKRGF